MSVRCKLAVCVALAVGRFLFSCILSISSLCTVRIFLFASICSLRIVCCSLIIFGYDVDPVCSICVFFSDNAAELFLQVITDLIIKQETCIYI